MAERRSRRMLILLLSVLMTSGSAWAHSMFQAAILLDYQTGSVHAELQLPPSRLERVLGSPVTADTLPQLEQAATAYLRPRIQATTLGGAPWKLQWNGHLRWEVLDGAPYVIAHLVLRPPSSGTLQTFILKNSILTDRLPQQVLLVSVRSDWNSSTFANDPQLVGILNNTEKDLVVDRAPGSWTRGFGSVFHLGVRHIAEGTDHLLFLLALLLPAPLFYVKGRWRGFAGVRHGFKKILRVVTAFTIGHSMTLALAASGLVHVPGRPVEALIAVSILVSAIHAIRPLFPGREALIAGSFGLVHGLAFASTLAELGLHGWEQTASILAFNLGIEGMQLVVVLCVMPSLMLLSRTALYKPFRLAGAVFAALAACGWVVQRTVNVNVPVDPVVDGLAKHAVLLASLLLVFALGSNLVFAPLKNTQANLQEEA